MMSISPRLRICLFFLLPGQIRSVLALFSNDSTADNAPNITMVRFDGTRVWATGISSTVRVHCGMADFEINRILLIELFRHTVESNGTFLMARDSVTSRGTDRMMYQKEPDGPSKWKYFVDPSLRGSGNAFFVEATGSNTDCLDSGEYMCQITYLFGYGMSITSVTKHITTALDVRGPGVFVHASMYPRRYGCPSSISAFAQDEIGQIKCSAMAPSYYKFFWKRLCPSNSSDNSSERELPDLVDWPEHENSKLNHHRITERDGQGVCELRAHTDKLIFPMKIDYDGCEVHCYVGIAMSNSPLNNTEADTVAVAKTTLRLGKCSYDDANRVTLAVVAEMIVAVLITVLKHLNIP